MTDNEQCDLIYCSPSVRYKIGIYAENLRLKMCNGRQLSLSTNCLPIPIFCKRVLWRSYVQTLDTICVIENGDSFLFSRNAQPPLGLWLRTLQCEWINILPRTPSICFLPDSNVLRLSLHLRRICCKGNPEINLAQCDCSFLIFFL